MIKITYHFGCNHCMNSFGSSLIWWKNKNVLYEENRLISANKMDILLQEYYWEFDKECEFCGEKNQFSFFNIKIEDQLLLSEDAAYQKETKTNKIVYRLQDLVEIIKSTETKFDLGCNNYSLFLNLPEDFNNTVSISMLLFLLAYYYEDTLFHYDHIDYFLSHFNFFLNKNIEKDIVVELNEQIELLLLSNSDLFDYDDYPELFLSYEFDTIFTGMDPQLCTLDFLKHFLNEYIKTHYFIVARLNLLLVPQGVKIKEGNLEYYREEFSDFL